MVTYHTIKLTLILILALTVTLTLVNIQTLIQVKLITQENRYLALKNIQFALVDY